MRLENTKVSLDITIPFDKPDSNGIIYKKDAVKNAINKFKTELPIIYRDNDSVKKWRCYRKYYGRIKFCIVG